MDHDRAKLSRRGLFRGAVQVSAVGAVVGSSLTGEAAAYTPGGDEMRAHYRVTDHVKAFYEARAPWILGLSVILTLLALLLLYMLRGPRR